MTSSLKEILEKANNTVFPEGTPEYLKSCIFNINKFELNDLLDNLERLEKLEKVIEILKEQFGFKFNDENKVIYLFIKNLSLHIYSWCIKSQQEYDLIKEVLECQKD